MRVRIPYEEIPHFPRSTVDSHSGHLLIGTLRGREVAVMSGRVHYYEGYTMREVTFPIGPNTTRDVPVRVSELSSVAM